MKYKKYFEDCNKELLRKSVSTAISLLDSNLYDFEGEVVLTTLISGGAGQYAGSELMELVGEERVEPDNENYVLVVDGVMLQLKSDLDEYGKKNGILPKHYSFRVGYSANDGSIDVFIINDKYFEDMRGFRW